MADTGQPHIHSTLTPPVTVSLSTPSGIVGGAPPLLRIGEYVPLPGAGPGPVRGDGFAYGLHGGDQAPTQGKGHELRYPWDDVHAARPL